MIKLTISRNDNIYECFPDIARTKDGTLVCVYRECMGHGPFPFSRIVLRRSMDDGRNWTDRQVLVECVATPEAIDARRDWLEPDALAGYEETRARVKEGWQTGSAVNCQRLTCLADGTLFLIADFSSPDELTRKARWTNRIWRSPDSGVTWNGPVTADLPEGLVPSVTELRNGDILVSLSIECPEGEPKERCFVCLSADGGHTWSDPVFLPDPDCVGLNESSFVELDDGMLVAICRATKADQGYKVCSEDGGRSWRGPFPTHMVNLEGRPKAGVLSSGEVCVTYRHGAPNEHLAMHVVTQEGLRQDDKRALIERQPTSADIPSPEGQTPPWYMTHYYPGRTFYMDMDRSVHRDSGYSGWVQLDNGDIYVVDYINDDAPLAQIRGYVVSRSDYILFPEGDLPWLHPSGQPFRGITLAMAERQTRANRERSGR